jgi:outer membrane protein OmpA-like peptidoglycan-associated protein
MRKLILTLALVGCGVTYNVRVVDQATNQPIDATLTVKKQDKVVKKQDAKGGQAKIGLSRGEFTLVGESQNYFVDSTRISPQNKQITLALEPIKSLIIRTIDGRTNNPVSADVELTYPDNKKETKSGEIVQFDNLRSGKYSIKVSAQDYEEYKQDIQLTKTETLTISLNYAITNATIKITDDKGKPVKNAIVSFKDNKGNEYKTTTDENGNAKISVPAGTYTIKAGSQGYVPNAKVVQLQPGDTSLDLSIARSGIFKVYFDFDKSDIRSDADATLRIACDLIKEVQSQTNKFSVRIEGHADQRGSDAYNLALSDRRAKSVYNYLVQICGIDKKYLRTFAFGERQPEDKECSIKNKSIWENTSDNSPIYWFNWNRDQDLSKASPCQKNRRAVVLTNRTDQIKKASIDYNFGNYCSIDGEIQGDYSGIILAIEFQQ